MCHRIVHRRNEKKGCGEKKHDTKHMQNMYTTSVFSSQHCHRIPRYYSPLHGFQLPGITSEQHVRVNSSNNEI